jgi:hypothetical protein
MPSVRGATGEEGSGAEALAREEEKPMSDEPYSDQGMFLPDGSIAVIVDAAEEVGILVPKKLAEPVSELRQALTMAAIKLMQDPAWVEDMAAEFRSIKQ